MLATKPSVSITAILDHYILIVKIFRFGQFTFLGEIYEPINCCVYVIGD